MRVNSRFMGSKNTKTQKTTYPEYWQMSKKIAIVGTSKYKRGSAGHGVDIVTYTMICKLGGAQCGRI